MAKRGRTKEGNVICSECGSIIQEDAATCEHCAEPLDGDFDAMACPYCGLVLAASETHCSTCGLRFKTETSSVIQSQEDEEFLSRLLDWGRKLETKEKATVEEDEHETEKATEIFKDVVGTTPPTPLQEETLKELQKSVGERAEFERREQSIMQIAQPLRKALDLRKAALDNIEGELNVLKIELQDLQDDSAEANRKRSEIERRMAEISIEKNAIRNLEENIENMDIAYRALLKQHRNEIVEKEKYLKSRLDAFKKEMDKRHKEKEKMEARENLLKKKEEELVVRIQSLKDRENSLKITEDQLRDQIKALEEEKDGLGDLKESTSRSSIVKGKWLVDEKELRSILKKSKSVRKTWLSEQRMLQEALAGGESVEEAEEESMVRFDKKEKELQKKIRTLENKLTKLEAEDKEVQEKEKELIADENELKKVLKVLDDLLEHLPDDVVEKFARSKDYKLYDKLMEDLGL